jgi:hypothetical protein
MNSASLVKVKLRWGRGARIGTAAHAAPFMSPGPEKTRPSPFTSLRDKHHRPDPGDGLVFSPAPRARRKPGASGGGRSEVKGEGRVSSGPEDMSGVPHPMATARATATGNAMPRLDR